MKLLPPNATFNAHYSSYCQQLECLNQSFEEKNPHFAKITHIRPKSLVGRKFLIHLILPACLASLACHLLRSLQNHLQGILSRAMK